MFLIDVYLSIMLAARRVHLSETVVSDRAYAYEVRRVHLAMLNCMEDCSVGSPDGGPVVATDLI